MAMTELRTLFASLGHTEVSTFIQSGNVVFTTGGSVTPQSFENVITDHFAIDITVVLRTVRELESVVRANPFTDVDPTQLHVGFLARKPSAAVVARLDAAPFQPEEFVLRGRELYLHLPNGMGRAKLPGYLDRQLKIPTTVRNWKTVTKLLELAGR
jgi:uncharacterized protein (DUF1697 family)